MGEERPIPHDFEGQRRRQARHGFHWSKDGVSLTLQLQRRAIMQIRTGPMPANKR